jgi:hypothetical protein
MKGFFCSLILLIPAPLVAQWDPGIPYHQQRRNPNDPHLRRELRERAVLMVGEDARQFVETHELAARAILACDVFVASCLTTCFNKSDLAKLPNLDGLLVAIAFSGDGNAVALFALEHLSDLADVDHFNAFMSSPVEYSLGLKDLEAGAAPAKADRLDREKWSTPLGDGRTVLIVASVVVAGVMIIRRKQKLAQDEDSLVV